MGRWRPLFLVEPRGSLTNDKLTQQGPALPSCFQPGQCLPGMMELDLGKGRGGQAGRGPGALLRAGARGVGWLL